MIPPSADPLIALLVAEGLPPAGGASDLLALLVAELRQGLRLYWQTAATILEGSGIRLTAPGEETLGLSRHFFSLLFLYAYHRAGIPQARRPFYVAVNQCLRGMVTGCDNLLDDEYKPTLETDLPSGGTRFRSVVDIMVSDRVLFEILSRLGEEGRISPQAMRLSAAATLRALAPSGVQEASEETGIGERLAPGEILQRVHHFKTGLLFQCTWAVPAILGDGGGEKVVALKGALYRLGMGCQLWDDLVDLATDMRQSRHNYVASLAFHGSDQRPRGALLQLAAGKREPGEVARFLASFPAIRVQACHAARTFVEEGLEALFDPAHRFMQAPAADFIMERIGVTRLLAEIAPEAAA